MYALGATRSLMPYQGSKWRFRHALRQHLRDYGARGFPRRIVLSDGGPWGIASGAVISPESRASIIDRLELLARLEPRAVYDALHGSPAPEDPSEFTAQFLFLQRLSYSGKAVGTRDGRWSSPGFNCSSAYGLPATERFGQVNPMIPSLIRTLRSYNNLRIPERLNGGRALASPPQESCIEPTFVYIDPPYSSSTDYPDAHMSRDELVQLSQAWRTAGAHVLVSEAEPIVELVKDGWQVKQLYGGRNDTSPFRGKQEEWLTFACPKGPPPIQPRSGVQP